MVLLVRKPVKTRPISRRTPEAKQGRARADFVIFHRAKRSSRDILNAARRYVFPGGTSGDPRPLERTWGNAISCQVASPKGQMRPEVVLERRACCSSTIETPEHSGVSCSGFAPEPKRSALRAHAREERFGPPLEQYLEPTSGSRQNVRRCFLKPSRKQFRPSWISRDQSLIADFGSIEASKPFSEAKRTASARV